MQKNPPSRSQQFILLACILAVTFLAYLPVLKAQFVLWDDDVHLLNNVVVRSLDRGHLHDMFAQRINGVYLPLTTLTFAFEYQWKGYDPFIYHLDNLLLHLIGTILVFYFVRWLGLSIFAAGFISFVFGVHPAHVESVAWVTERKDVLYAALYLAALLTYARYLDSFMGVRSGKEAPRKKYRFLLGTYILGILSMLAKPMALSLPLILILIDWFRGRKINKEVAIEKIPLFFGIAVLAWLTHSVYARVPGQNIFQSILIWPWTCVFYLRQFLFPVISVPVWRLPHPISLFNYEYMVSLAVLILILYALVRYRRDRWLMFSMGFYFFSMFFLFRFDELKDTNIVADRYMYLPSLGFMLLLGYGVDRWWMKGEKIKKKVLLISLLLYLGIFSFKTYHQASVWINSLSLWTHQYNLFPNEYVSLNNLATTLREEPAYKEAERKVKQILRRKAKGDISQLSHDDRAALQKVNYIEGLYQRAVKNEPAYVDGVFNLGRLYQDIEKMDEAVVCFNQAIKLNPEFDRAYYQLGEVYSEQHNVSRAIEAFERTVAANPQDEEIYYSVLLAYNKALELNPQDVSLKQAHFKLLERYVQFLSSRPRRITSLFNLGNIYSEMHDDGRAAAVYKMVLDSDPGHVGSLYNLGNAYKKMGRLKEALDMYLLAVKLAPNQTEVLIGLAGLYGQEGDILKAREYYDRALKLSPNNPNIYYGLGYIHDLEGNNEEALRLYNQEIALDPGNADGYYGLGNIYAKLKMNDRARENYLKAVEVNPGYVDGWVNLSILSYLEKDYEGAVKYYEMAYNLGYQGPEEFVKALEPYRKK